MLTKLVDGESVVLSKKEEAAIKAAWAAQESPEVLAAQKLEDVNQLRRSLYAAAGVTDQARLDALWDAVFEGDTKKGKALKATRDKVRKGKSFPKRK